MVLGTRSAVKFEQVPSTNGDTNDKFTNNADSVDKKCENVNKGEVG